MLKNITPKSSNIAFDPNDPRSFHYDAQALDLKRKQQLAEALNGFKMRQGGITNPGGFYAGGATGLDAVLKGLTAYMGAKQQQDADEGSKQLDRASNDAYRAAIEMRGTPSEQERQLANDPAVWLHRNPEQVGPQPEEVAQSFPVRQAPVETRNLPPQQPQAQAPFMSGGGGQFRGNGASGSWGAPEQGPAAGALAPALQAAQPQAMPAPAPMQAQPAPTEQAPERFVDRQALLSTIEERDRLARTRQADSEDLLHRSGPRGQALLQALQAAQMQRIAKGSDIEKPQVVGDGAALVGPDGTVLYQNGSSKGPKEAAEMRIKLTGFKTEAQEGLNGNQRALDSIARAEAAIQKWNPQMGGTLGQARMAFGKFFGEKDALEFKNALDSVALSNLKAMFGSNTSNVELLQLAQQFGVDGSVNKDTLMNLLQQMRAAALRGKETNSQRLSAIQEELSAYGKPEQSGAPKAEPNTINGLKPLDWKR